MTRAWLLLGLWAARAWASPQDTGIEEHLGTRLPRELVFTTHEGKRVELGRLLDAGRPVLVTPVYFACPSLCGRVLDGVTRSLAQTGLEAGRDYELVTYSIDSTEPWALAKAKREALVARLGGASAGWTFLVGDSGNVRALSEALGFRSRYDDELKQYVHSAAIMLVTPDGRVSRYLYGTTFPPRELRLSLVDAADGRVGTTVDRVLLACTRYDASTQSYRWSIAALLRAGGVVSFLCVALLLGVLWRRELERARAH